MENFLDLFPKGRDKIRLTQEIILTDIKKELDKGTKFIIAEAPTGTGKSDTGIHLALYKKGGTFLTTQKILQNQYAKEFNFLKLVKLYKMLNTVKCLSWLMMREEKMKVI